MNALPVVLVTDQLPFPPRNGITLPLFNYLVQLEEQGVRVELVLFAEAGCEVDESMLQANRQRFGKVSVVVLERRSKLMRAMRELLGLEMFQHGWKSSSHDSERLEGVLSDRRLLVSPFSAVAKLASVVSLERLPLPKVAAVNDCTTAEYYCRPLGVGSHSTRLKRLKARVDWLRSFGLSRIENRLLQPFDSVFLQTQADQIFMRDLVSDVVADKVDLCPNGVNEALFSVPTSRTNRQVLFVAEMSGEHGAAAQWLIEKVWPLVSGRVQDARLHLVGRGAGSGVLRAVSEASSVVYTAYAEDLVSVYADCAVVVCPVFKGFGLINKAVEGMASGRVVVGGIQAFNGIRGFSSGEHGVVCPAWDANSFADNIVRLLGDEKLRDLIGADARNLIQNGFSWRLCADLIRERLMVQ